MYRFVAGGAGISYVLFTGRNTAVRSVSTTFVVLLLPILLVVTTPTGTGAGAHLGQLVQPLFAHVHLVGGKIIIHEGGQSETSAPRPDGIALGAGAGASAAAGGLSLVPTLPYQVLSIRVEVRRAPRLELSRTPSGLAEAPPDPPPNIAPLA
jgi:hypothetical protein